jgi:methionyl-tRNA formyltransferase
VRTVFLGTSRFAASVLGELAGGSYRPLLVLTRPDRPAGRGRRLEPPPVAETARRLGIDVEQPESVNDDAAREAIAARRPRAVVVCAFGALIREPLLLEHELLNVHPSLLPRWRGAAPVERAIMAGERKTGVSIMRVTAGLDSGPVCLAQSEPIESDDTYGSLSARLERLGARLLTDALDALERDGCLRFAEQEESQATYAEKIGAADRVLDPARPAGELERVVRALHPHVGARLQLPDGEMLGVLCARTLDEAGSMRATGRQQTATSVPLQAASGPAPGVVAAVEGRLLYGTTEGMLELLEVQPPGGRPMDAASYLRGHAVD